MTREEAVQLCRTFRRRGPGRELTCLLEPGGEVRARGPYGWLRVPDYRMVFLGGKRGPHSLAVSASTPARAEAHWRGYAEDNGLFAPAAGERVRFPSPSSPSGYRTGHAVKATATRVLVAYKFKDGRPAAPKWVALEDIIFQ